MPLNRRVRIAREHRESFRARPVPIASIIVNRVQEYGLEFYLNRAVQKYDGGNIPPPPMFWLQQNTGSQAGPVVPGRRVSILNQHPGAEIGFILGGVGKFKVSDVSRLQAEHQ